MKCRSIGCVRPLVPCDACKGSGGVITTCTPCAGKGMVCPEHGGHDSLDEAASGPETRLAHQQGGPSAAMPAASRDRLDVPAQEPLTYLRNAGGNQIGPISADGSVKINQSVKNYARKNPVPFSVIVTVLAGLLGWGGYGVVNAVSGPDASTAQGTAESMVEAINNRDWSALLKVACPGPTRDDAVRQLESLKPESVPADFKVSLKDVKDFGDTASFILTMHISGQSKDSKTIVLNKTNGEWCTTPRL